VRNHGFSGHNQFFHQRMAHQHQPGLAPQRAQVDEQPLPVAQAQGRLAHVGRLQQRTVFIKHRERIAQRPAHGLHTIRGNGLGLQLVQAALGARELVPHQAVEEVVQVVARGHAAGAPDVLLVSHALGQLGLGHKTHRQGWRRGGLQRPVHCHIVLLQLLRHRLAEGAPRRQPGGAPVDGVEGFAYTSRHGRASPARRGLSSASPNAKLSGGVHDSRRRVMVPVLRGRL